MNLQRFVSSVYCENITEKDFLAKLDKELQKIDKLQNNSHTNQPTLE